MKPLPALYATVTFLSAFLLFLLEPIAARELLPLFGGSAAVWTTCLVFFQCALLIGYIYAHFVISRLRPRAQMSCHLLLLLLGVFTLLFGFHAESAAPSWHPPTSHPLSGILWLLTATIGLPFVALAATTPLLQAWFARTGSAAPWWLFALSNTASLLALLLYPTVVEPGLALHSQTVVWAVGFVLFAALCGLLAFQSRRTEFSMPVPAEAAEAGVAPRRSPWFLWVLLPGCGSMLLCSVTNHLGENIAAIPLLWIVPLAAYLISYVVAFASPKAWPRFISARMLAVTLATFAEMLYNSRTSLPVQIAIPVYTLALLFACLFCHAELYRLRPKTGDLTAFYLFLSLGSAVGAILIGVVAPSVLSANYDLAISVVFLAGTALAAMWNSGLPARLAWSAAAVALIYIATVQAHTLSQNALVEARSFYGSLRVTESHLPPEAETTRTLYHGRIQHGTQLFGDGFRTLPSSYYAHNSGVGLALDECCGGRPRRIGVVGLGAGTVAAYGRPGDDITFYEIDPLVERLSRAFFTYLRDSRADVRVVLGDARLSIAGELASRTPPPDDVIVLDAFSGDAIPVHLLTAQAISLYRRRLRPDGVLAFNISSQYLDLAPELATQASNAGMRAVLIHSDADETRGIFAADWVLLSAGSGLLSQPQIAKFAQPLTEVSGARLWTDDYSSLLPLLKWRTSAAVNKR